MFFPNVGQFTKVVVLGVCACMYGRNNGRIWLIHGIFYVPWYCDVGSSVDVCMGAVAGCVGRGGLVFFHVSFQYHVVAYYFNVVEIYLLWSLLFL
mmetsp:Transcript_14186/g.20764  ORF Transcript_14186/g.20764 Transcript_14186/m.20764 type:complete len:95 (-) Transcript_14186:865-1149(-)